MKSIVFSAIALILLFAVVIVNGVIVSNLLSELTAKLKRSEEGDARAAILDAYEFMNKWELLFAITIPDDMLGEVQGGIMEAIHASQTSDEAYLESVISRLISEVDQIRRLGDASYRAIL